MMLVACARHAGSILRRFACGSFLVPEFVGRRPGLRDAGRAIRRVGIVFRPIVDLVSTFLPVQESDLGKSTHEFSGVAGPVCSDFDILCAHPCKVAYRAVLGDP